MINRPEVLFLDEPTLGLDPAGKEDVVRQLADIAVHDGTAVVLCTHLLDEVERACDRVAIMTAGKLLTTGTVDEVIDSSDVPRTSRLRVHSDDIAAAHDVVGRLECVDDVRFDNARPGDLDLRLAPHARATSVCTSAGGDHRCRDRDPGVRH